MVSKDSRTESLKLLISMLYVRKNMTKVIDCLTLINTIKGGDDSTK